MAETLIKDIRLVSFKVLEDNGGLTQKIDPLPTLALLPLFSFWELNVITIRLISIIK